MCAAWWSCGKIPQFFMENDGSERLLSLEQVLRGDFEGDLQYHEGVANDQVVSQRRSAAVDASFKEDVDGSTIGQLLCWKSDIDPLLAKSPIFIEITDSDDPQAMETMGLCRLGEPGLVGTRSVPPSVLGDAPSAAGPSSLGAPGVYLPGWNLMPDSLLSKQGPAQIDEITEKVWFLEEEQRKFDELYPMLSGEKTFIEAQVATPDGEFATKVSRRKALEADIAWVLQKGVLPMVYRVVESNEFVIGIHRVKVAPGSSDPDVVARSVDAMHAAIRAFVETEFMSYLRLGELGLADLCQLCSKEEELVSDNGVEGTAST
ncbi:unnamed protein product [Lactuca saligna]|uniref:Uncharacterized protein n=1 Tax=Lactuca saligna TaxID=75948 RepID=A0AA35YVY8_LACSI|nr:unnamed protein product [Lactuca saligna]